MFAFLFTESLQKKKRSTLKEKVMPRDHSRSFYRRPLFTRDANHTDRVALPESVSIPSKINFTDLQSLPKVLMQL